MLYLFDLDDTLISGYMSEPDRKFQRWQVLSGRATVLHRLLDEGHTLGICTNQGGVAFGLVSEREFWAKIGSVLKRLELTTDQIDVRVCFAHPRARDDRYRTEDELLRRKPAPGMLYEQMQAHRRAAASGVVYVGDSDDDREAARLAPPVVFIPTHVFFATPSLPD